MDKKVRSSHRCSLGIGRNWYEVLRQFDALFITTFHRVVIPANWGQGQEVMIAKDATPEEAANYRFAEPRKWFKITNCPDN